MRSIGKSVGGAFKDEVKEDPDLVLETKMKKLLKQLKAKNMTLDEINTFFDQISELPLTGMESLQKKEIMQ